MSFGSNLGRSVAPTPLSNDTRASLLYEANRISELVAFLLALYVGLFGAHNFYLGRKSVAITQLVLTCLLVTLIMSIIWVVVDLFRFPASSASGTRRWRENSGLEAAADDSLN